MKYEYTQWSKKKDIEPINDLVTLKAKMSTMCITDFPEIVSILIENIQKLQKRIRKLEQP